MQLRQALLNLMSNANKFTERGTITVDVRQGHDKNAVAALQPSFPAEFEFSAVAPPARNHDVGRLFWRLGPPGSPPVVDGMDVAQFKDSRIGSLRTPRIVAPGLAPRRLVVDPNASYFWLACGTATANRDADRAVPLGSRELVRVYACIHR